ncbi:hypothetical protein [Hylemonella gracilis]|nr:hypothetical protein [Hylemonella gracilis]
MTTVSASGLTNQSTSIHLNPEALRLRQGSEASRAVVPRVNASGLAHGLAVSMPSVIRREQALGGEVPADNTYQHLQALNVAAWTDSSAQASVLGASTQSEQAWASAPGDVISDLMAHNFGRSQPRDFVNQWRDLGGALLSHLATLTSTPPQYRQTFLANVDPRLPLDDQYSSVRLGAATAHFQVKTRSGQTVDLQIAVNKSGGGIPGVQVAVSSSGALSDAERKALAALAGGLDEALAGLGRSDAPEMNLSGLMNYDRSVFSSLSLDIETPAAQKTALYDSFSLRLGVDKNTLAYKGPLGEMQMRLDAAPLLRGSVTQRQAAIAQYLQQIDAAASRSHADETLVNMFKSGFEQMLGIAESQAGKGVAGIADAMALLGYGLTDQIQPLLTGLPDFEASFSGKFTRNNARGVLSEEGEVSYAISQQTKMQIHRREKDASIVQTRHERLDASYARARNGAMLDLKSGNYDRHTIRDDSTITTLIEALDGAVDSAEERTDKKTAACP